MNLAKRSTARTRRSRSVRREARRVAAGVFLVSAFTLCSAIPGLAAITASSELDICTASADPCLITQAVDVVSGSVLDFGVRAVEIRGSGLLNVGSGTVLFRSGSLLVDVSGIGIKLNEGLTAALLVGGSPISGRCGSVTGLACSKKGTSKLACSN